MLKFLGKKLPGIKSVNISLPDNYNYDNFRWTFNPVVEGNIFRIPFHEKIIILYSSNFVPH